MSGVALVPGKSQLSDSNGNPLAGGTVDVYLAGTTTRTNSWQDQALTSLNTNPIGLDASGSCSMWLDGSTLYKLVVKNAAGATQSHLGGDNISGAAGSGALVSFLQAGTGAVPRSAQDKMREAVTVLDFGAIADDPTKKTTNLAAFRAACRYLKSVGGGDLHVPRGTWHLSCAYPVFVPSNVTVTGVRGASTVKPDPSDLPAGSDPAVFCTGDPDTNTRAGNVNPVVGANVGDIDPTSVVSNVHFRHLTVVSDFVGPLPSAAHSLRGIHLRFAYGASVEECDFYKLPNSGIQIQGGARVSVCRNVVRECGWDVGYAGTRNGISLSGWMDHTDASLSSRDFVCSGNVVSDNCEEGIQFNHVAGIVITDNVLTGNADRGIEGDSGYALPDVTQATYAQEVPADVLIANNYVNGKGAHGASSLWGITVMNGNEGRITIRGNYIRNVANDGAGSSGGAILVDQDDGGVALVEDNTVEGVTPAVGYHAILTKASRVSVRGNRVLSFTGGGNQCGVVARYTTSVVVENNHIEAGTDRGIYATCGWAAGVYTPSVVVVRGNTVLGTRADGLRMDFPYETTLTMLDVADNSLLGLNTTAATDKAAIHIEGAAGVPLSINSLYVTGNRATYAGATRYAINSVNVAANAIVNANLTANFLGTPTMPFGTRAFETANIVTNLYSAGNGYPGERITYGTAAPVAGTWAQGDRVLISNPAAGGFIGWVCTGAGTPGTWKTFGVISP